MLQLPVICVAAFGAYLLGALAYGLATFRNCPEELQALQKVRLVHGLPGCAAWRPMQLHLLPCRRCLFLTLCTLVQDIALARAELAARGVTVDSPAGR